MSQRRDRSLMAERIYKTRTLRSFGGLTQIILQRDNGPCSLIAICNVLLLSHKLDLCNSSEVPGGRLLALVAEQLTNVPEIDQEMLNKLTSGVDVNPKFTGICDFEASPFCRIFHHMSIKTSARLAG